MGQQQLVGHARRGPHSSFIGLKLLTGRDLHGANLDARLL